MQLSIAFEHPSLSCKNIIIRLAVHTKQVCPSAAELNIV